MLRGLLAGAFMLLIGPAFATDASRSAAVEADDFAVNNAIAALYHEIGHMLIDQFHLPILGREEDAADTIATLLLIGDGTPEATIAAFDTVEGYLKAADAAAGPDDQPPDYADEHLPELARAYDMACLLLGRDKEKYAHLLDLLSLSDGYADRCADEYETAASAWMQLTRDHQRRSKPAGPGLTVSYEPAPPDLADIEDLLKRHRVLESAAARVTDKYLLRRSARVVARSCGETNAFYDRDRDEISFCYEYGRFYRDLILDPDKAAEDLE